MYNSENRYYLERGIAYMEKMKKALTKPEKWILMGIPAIFLLGSVTHFIYELTGGNTIVGMLAPVNESVWEHLKLLLMPIILWWGLYYLLSKTNYGINGGKWWSGALVSLLVGMAVSPLLFYFYTNAFGIKNVIIDILISLAAVTAGQLAGLCVYRNGGINMVFALAGLAFVAALFIIFTFSTPHLPIFLDPVTGTYGING